MNASPDPQTFEAARPAPEPPIAAAELVSVLWRRKGLVVACGIAAVAIAVAALSQLPQRYVAQAEVMLEGRAPRVVDLTQVAPEIALDEQSVQSEIRLVQSQQLLARVARKLRLTEDPEFGAFPREPGGMVGAFRRRAEDAAREAAARWLGWAPPPASPAPDARTAELAAVAALRRRLTVAQQDVSRVIAVRVESDRAATAALLANAIADQYIVDQLEAKFDATERAARWLQERLSDLASRLEAAEAEAEAHRARLDAQQEGALGVDRRRQAVTAALTQLDAAGGAGTARAEALRADLAALDAEAARRDADDIVQRQLDRETEAMAALHQAFLARLKETRAQTGLERPDARLIAEAAPPQEPSAPDARLILAFALVGGLSLGGAAAFVRESTSGVHHSVDAAERDAGLPVLGALPRPDRRRMDPAEVVRRRPGSRLAEAVRDLRAGLLAGHAGPIVLAVVSAGPAEGKSTLAAQLAESCARLGRRTVLVDGDVRNPAQARRYGLSAETDLLALLEGAATLDEVLWVDPESGLAVLPCQPAPARRADLLAGPALPEALAALRARFDVVILDTPPLLAVADGRLLASAADRCVVALRWGRTLREDLRAALRALAEAGGRAAGLALVDTPLRADPRPGRAGSGGRYGRFSEYFED